jgi:hypothetical protein
MITYMERETGQVLVPGVISGNPKCEGVKVGSGIAVAIHSCEDGEVVFDYGTMRLVCSACNGTGLKYEAIDVDI